MKLRTDADAELNGKSDFGITPLMAAALTQSIETVDVLLSHGTKVNTQDKNGNTALSDADVNHSNKDGVRPLMLAAESSTTTVVTLLLTSGADVDHRTKDGSSMLWFAAFNTEDRVLDFMFHFDDRKFVNDIPNDANHFSILMNAPTTTRNLGVIRMLLSVGANVNYVAPNGEPALSESAGFNPNPEIVRALVDGGAKVNVRDDVGYTPLMSAAERKNPAFAEILFRAAANPTVVAPDGASTLSLIQQEGDSMTFNVLSQAAKDKRVGYFR